MRNGKLTKPTVPCAACAGFGKIFVPEKYVEVLTLLRERGSANSTDVHALHPKEVPTAANNRLEFLRRHGFAKRSKENGCWVYRPTDRLGS